MFQGLRLSETHDIFIETLDGALDPNINSRTRKMQINCMYMGADGDNVNYVGGCVYKVALIRLSCGDCVCVFRSTVY